MPSSLLALTHSRSPFTPFICFALLPFLSFVAASYKDSTDSLLLCILTLFNPASLTHPSPITITASSLSSGFGAAFCKGTLAFFHPPILTHFPLPPHAVPLVLRPCGCVQRCVQRRPHWFIQFSTLFPSPTSPQPPPCCPPCPQALWLHLVKAPLTSTSPRSRCRSSVRSKTLTTRVSDVSHCVAHTSCWQLRG